MRIFGVLIIAVSLLLTILCCFFGLPLPTALKGLLDIASLICVLGPVLGGCLVAYGSEWGAAFKLRPSREEATIAVGVYKLAVSHCVWLDSYAWGYGRWPWYGYGDHIQWHGRSVDYGSIRVGIRLHLISTLAMLLPTPVGQGFLTFGVEEDVSKMDKTKKV